MKKKLSATAAVLRYIEEGNLYIPAKFPELPIRDGFSMTMSHSTYYTVAYSLEKKGLIKRMYVGKYMAFRLPYENTLLAKFKKLFKK